MKKIIVLLSFIWVCVNATFSWGNCPHPVLEENFSIDKYLGEWYEIVRNKDMPYEKGDCNKAKYALGQSGYIEVLNTEVFNKVNKSASGYAYCDYYKPAQCFVKFSVIAPAGDYKILSTDYNNYALVFSCFSIGFAHWKYVWIISREKYYDYHRLLPDIEALGIPESALYITSHSNCA